MRQPRNFHDAVVATLVYEASTAFAPDKPLKERALLLIDTPLARDAGSLWRQFEAFDAFAIAKGPTQGGSAGTRVGSTGCLLGWTAEDGTTRRRWSCQRKDTS